MSERLKLIQDFVSSHHDLAARALEEMAPDVAGTLLESVSEQMSVTVLAAMLPYHAARCIEILPLESAARYLTALPARKAALILRNIAPAQHSKFLDAMPKRHSLRISLVLDYPRGLAGAWIHPLTLALPLECSVSDAQQRLINDDYSQFGLVYVVDNQGCLCGMVSVPKLFMQTAEGATIQEILMPCGDPIAAASSLARAAAHPDWSETDFMPVVDRDGAFAGILRYAELRAAMVGTRAPEHSAGETQDLFALSERFYAGLADVMTISLSRHPLTP